MVVLMRSWKLCISERFKAPRTILSFRNKQKLYMYCFIQNNDCSGVLNKYNFCFHRFIALQKANFITKKDISWPVQKYRAIALPLASV